METSIKRSKKQLTPEEKYAVRAKARRQFKAGFHKVVAHLQWLIPEREPTVRTHDHSQFTYEDKCLLMKPTPDRTKDDKIHLKKLICNTKMAKQYPMSVRNGLACVTYLRCYGPNRILTKQNATASEFIFLLDGKIRETHERMDPLLNTMAIEEKAILLPGHGYGDISILNKTPRLSTKSTLTEVMLLCVTKEDFEDVLEHTVKEMWDEINEQFSTIPYFQQYNQTELSELLIISRLLYFQPDDTLLGDQKGFKNFTYIILDGTCRMIENLQVIPRRTILSTTYTLYKPSVPDPVSKLSVGTLLYPSETVNPTISTNVSHNKKKPLHSKEKKHSTKDVMRKTPSDRSKDTTLTFSETTSLCPQSKTPRNGGLPPYVETHYMQLCTMKYGSTFNVGENFHNRRVVAITPVKCLIVPKYWILTHDKDKTWVSLCLLLDRHIPNTQQIFKEFKNQHKWLKYRQELQDDVLAAHYYPSYNTVHNIPPFYRVEYQVPQD